MLDVQDVQQPPNSDGSPAAARAKLAKRIAIFVVTYNAVATLRSVLDRIPAEVWDKVEEVFVFDDSSHDDTYLVGLGYKALHGRTKLSVFRNERNLGYGGNQIRGYKYAIEQGYDIVALLHGDGQYAPEALPALLAPLERGEADAVFGSRMMTPGAALAGGMPLYKYVGNRILTTVENGVLGLNLSEFHSGYRLYSCYALKQIPFERNTHEFHFDTQIIIQLHAAGMRIVEIPIPTFYGDEICYVNGIKYAQDILRSVLDYELHELGLVTRPQYEVRPRITLKRTPTSSHSQLLALVGPPPREVIDLGGGQSELAHALRESGHLVMGLDIEGSGSASHLPAEPSAPAAVRPERRFDVVLLADVLDRIPDPRLVLEQALTLLRPEGTILVSLPNAVHWSVRTHIALGRFEYTNKGILDRRHLRFFTHASALRLFEEVGLKVTEHRTTPIPWERVLPPMLGRFARDNVEKIDYLMTKMRPDLFAYEHVFVLCARAARAPGSD